MPTYFGRATTETWSWFSPDTPLHGVVLHPADNSVSRSHIHFIFDATLGHKSLRRYLRQASGLTGKMDISVKDFDPTKDYAKYLLRNSKCQLLYSADTEIGRKLAAQSLVQFPQAVPTASKTNPMKDRINAIYDQMSMEQSDHFHTSFSSFANEMLRRYYKDHVDYVIPGEGSINTFKSYILHLWGLYIEYHLPEDWKDRHRDRYVRLLFGQAVVDPVHDTPSL